VKTPLHSLARFVTPALAVLATASSAYAAPDPSISLTLERPSAGFQSLLLPGETLGWLISVDNVGDATAPDVVVRAPIPSGMAFVVGSLWNVDPATSTVSYSKDGGATFGYTPVGGPGANDTLVTDIRIALGSIPVNPRGTANFASSQDFLAGTFSNSWYEPGVGLRVSGGATAGSWISPAFPREGVTGVNAWSSIAITDQVVSGIADATYDVIDAASGITVPGFAGVRPTNGVLDISTISTAAHSRLAVRVNMTADASNSCFTEIYDQARPDDPCTPDILGVNNSDVVFGNLWRNGAACREKPYRWTVGGGMTVLASLVGDTVAAYGYDLNDGGVMVGESMAADLLTTHAVLWANGATSPTDLHGSMGDEVSSWATDISENGKVCGMRSGVTPGPFRSLSGSVATYDALPNATWDWRTLISENGDVAGRYLPVGETLWHAFVWQADGSFVDIGAPGDVAFVTGINASGVVIGYGDGKRAGWVYVPGTGITTIGEGLASGTDFVANAVADTGVVVGSYVDASGYRRAYSRSSGGVITTLTASPWNNSEALDLNGNGAAFIVGYDTTLPTAPFARVGFNSGGATSWLPSPGQIPEVFGQRQAQEGYSTFNNSPNVVGYYRTSTIVAGAPAEIPYFAGDCSNVAPIVTSIQARWDSSAGLTMGFDAVYLADGCSTNDMAIVNLSSTGDGNLANNAAFDTMRLARPDVSVSVFSDKGIFLVGSIEQVTWTVVVRNLGVAAAPVQVFLDLPADTAGSVAPTELATTNGGRQTLLVANLAASETRTLTWVSEHYTETSGLTVQGLASVVTTEDCVPSNNSATATAKSGSGANLYATGVATASQTTGGPISWTVTFGNNGTEAFVGQATLTVSMEGLVLSAAVLSEVGPFSFNYTPGDTTATVVVDSDVGVGGQWSLTTEAAAPDCANNADAMITSSAFWAAGAGGPLDDNATDDVTFGTTNLLGEATDDPSLCQNPCTTVADCAVGNEACAGTVQCIANVGCVYNSVPLGFDADSNPCTINERCEAGSLMTEPLACAMDCAQAAGAVCNPATGLCEDTYGPGPQPDQDSDGVPDYCDSCPIDYYDCTGAGRSAVYAAVNNEAGQAYGSIRCFHDGSGTLTCDTETDGVTLIVYPDLVCAP